MVNMIGFHHREPVYNTANYGEPGFYIERRDRPSVEHPSRALMSSPTAHAVFTEPDHARQFISHPGAISHLARAYLDSQEVLPL